MHLPDGTLLQGGKYKIVRYIDSGGFGCTYEAVHRILGYRYAIKEFFPKSYCNRDSHTCHVTVGNTQATLVDKLKKKFIGEACAIAGMSHPEIVKVSDVFEENGTAYYVMEYIEGKPLSRIIKEKGRLSEEETLDYILQVCDALDYVHSKNRLHLDIKPDNIMIDNKGRTILIDFGASKYYDEETGEQTSTLLGIYTKGYAPLEQVTRNFKTFSAATDIYAIGATMYKCLTGETPIDSSLLVLEEELKPLPSSISEPTKKAIMSAMEGARKKRPQTIKEFLAILDKKAIENKVKEIECVFNNVNLHEEDEEEITDPYVPDEEEITGPGVFCDEISEPKNNPITLPNTINGHEYVDLGLPSGLKWATCNIGANKPEEYGDYFAWGEIHPKEVYSRRNSETLGRKTKWLRSKGYIGTNKNLTSSHDAARQNWGGSWRIPTMKEINELINCTTTEWITWNGVKGRLVKSKINGKSIFFPAAGNDYFLPNSTYPYGMYCISTLNEEGSEGVFYLLVDYQKFELRSHGRRNRGNSVRPVSE